MWWCLNALNPSILCYTFKSVLCKYCFSISAWPRMTAGMQGSVPSFWLVQDKLPLPHTNKAARGNLSLKPRFVELALQIIPVVQKLNDCRSCCSVPQLNTQVTEYVHPHPVQVQVHCIGSPGRGLRVQPFSITPPCRQLHSVSRGLCLHFRRMRFVMSGAYHDWR